MTISNDLMYAILAMDAYNRDYGAGIKSLGGKGAKIGNATLGDDSDIFRDENGNRLDEADNPDPFLISPGASDIWSGWITGAGFLSSQARLAAAFYRSVAGDNLYNANISFTGHSLGGGLAGMAADL
ncbi:MAG: hypothetical protein GY743_17725 [Planctomycetaceae bacterium]|nr:hypothetical protein [Planctomycetaceae bacterium]